MHKLFGKDFVIDFQNHYIQFLTNAPILQFTSSVTSEAIVLLRAGLNSGTAFANGTLCTLGQRYRHNHP